MLCQSILQLDYSQSKMAYLIITKMGPQKLENVSLLTPN